MLAGCCCVCGGGRKSFSTLPWSRVDKMKIKNYNSENFPFTVTPSPVINCSVSNYTREVAEILCTSGYDGGLPQRFLLEMISRRNKAIK
jgi:hypothetical protein